MDADINKQWLFKDFVPKREKIRKNEDIQENVRKC